MDNISLNNKAGVLFGQHTTFIHAYIHNSSQQAFSQDDNQLLTPFMLCALTLYRSCGTYSINSSPNDGFLRSFFMAILLALKVFIRNLLRGSCQRRNIFILSFLCLTWDLNSGLTSNKPIHYLLDYGDSI